MEDQCNTDCTHTDQERMLRAMWVTLEVQKALECGYELIETEVVWHWKDQAVYEPITKEGLFTDYIDRFLKLKQEASGWPAWCKTVEEKEDYMRSYFENEGIQLDEENIVPNPGLRSLAKLCLNTLWGMLCFLILFGIT